MMARHVPLTADRCGVDGVMFATDLVAKGERPDESTNKILWLGSIPGASTTQGRLSAFILA